MLFYVITRTTEGAMDTEGAMSINEYFIIKYAVKYVLSFKIHKNLNFT